MLKLEKGYIAGKGGEYGNEKMEMYNMWGRI